MNNIHERHDTADRAEEKNLLGSPLELWGNSQISDLDLYWNGSFVETITSSPRVLQTSTGEVFFSKKDPFQLLQLQYLGSLGASIPKDIHYLGEGNFASKGAGLPLQTVLSSEIQEEQVRLVQMVGRELSQMHEILDELDAALPEDAVSTDYNHTAHSINSFIRRFIELEGDDFLYILSNRDRLPSTVGKLVEVMQELSLSYVQRMENSLARETTKFPFGNELFFGDVKPENMVVQVSAEDTCVTFLDPLIMRGSKGYDVAKFISRLAFDLPRKSEQLAKEFLNAYSPEMSLTSPVIEGHDLRDIVIIDGLNVLTSYLKRLISGDLRYRLVNELQTPHYPSFLVEHFLSLREKGQLVGD